MFTVNDMLQELSKESEETEKLIDTWLKEVVLPAMREAKSNPFDIPSGIKIDSLIFHLGCRGFDVSISGNLLQRIYVHIPEKGEAGYD